MNGIFENIINMSITGSVVIIIVLIARMILKGFPKKYSYALWSIVAFRLCCPFGIKSVFSIFNLNPLQSPADISKANGTMNYIHSPINTGTFVQPAIKTNIIGNADEAIKTTAINSIWFWVWIAGAVLLISYSIISYIKIKKQLSDSTKYDNNIYQNDKVASPFILGIIKPKIYIPYNIEENLEHVIAHEKYHLKRCDHIVKFISFLILCMHWFNPLCWLAFCLMSKDMEMSCDEKVLSLNTDIKKQYSTALLSFAINKKIPSPSPLCFGESSVKGRIKNILKYKKPKFIISVIAIILVGTIVAGCSLNPQVAEEITKNTTENINTLVSSDVNTKIDKNTYMGGKCIAQSPILSSICNDGNNDYNKVIIKDNHLTVYNSEGVATIDSDGEITKLDRENIDKVNVQLNGSFFLREELNEYFSEIANTTELIVKNDKDTVNYVYFNNGVPFAIGDSMRIFELMPYCNNLQGMLSEKIKEINYDKYPNDSNKYYYAEAHDTLQIAKGDIDGNNKNDYITVFTYPYYAVLERQNCILCDIGGCVIPTAITFSINENGYKYHSVWQPKDDTSHYYSDLKEKFPPNSIYAYNTNDLKLYNNYRYKLRREAYKSAIEQTDYNADIAEAIDKLCKNGGLHGKSPLNPTEEYNGVYYTEYDALICYGEYTMRYIYTEFLKGGQTDIHGDVMAHMMKKILDDQLKISCKNGQEYFDRYLEYISRIYEKNKDDEYYMQNLIESEPYNYLLLEMAGKL